MWKADSRNPGKKVFFPEILEKKFFFPEILEKKYSGYAAILENKKRGEEELHKLEWAPRNEKWAHWNKNRSKGKKKLISPNDLPKKV